MPFPITQDKANDLRGAIELVAKIKNVLTEAKKGLAVGSINADDLLLFVTSIIKYYKPLKEIQLRLDLGGNASGGIAEDLYSLVNSIASMLAFIGNNLPKQGGYLLTHSLDQNFNLVPRVFSGATITAFNTQVDSLLQEIE